MQEKLRRMKKYYPRRKRHSTELKRQLLSDLEHRVNMDIGRFLVLNEEGPATEVEPARIKVRSDLMKYGRDMQKLALEIGGEFPEAVDNFIKGVDSIIHNSGEALDQAKIHQLYKATEHLESKLNLKHKIA
jgi:hypothetical protein